jgi:hypothetical protein
MGYATSPLMAVMRPKYIMSIELVIYVENALLTNNRKHRARRVRAPDDSQACEKISE